MWTPSCFCYPETARVMQHYADPSPLRRPQDCHVVIVNPIPGIGEE